jgi:hypothetical protein
MRLLGAFVQILICCLMVFSQSSAAVCGSSLSPQEAYARATAVFVGKVLSVTTLYHPGTKLAGPTPYHQVKLQVEKSWKLVDRQEVTLVTENTVPNACGSFSPGETYLIYADRLNDIFFVSAASRTNRVTNAGEDLKLLGEPRLSVSPGEFRSYHILVYGGLVCVVIVLLIALFLYRLNKKPIGPV